MKLTKSKLKQIIKEEMGNSIKEHEFASEDITEPIRVAIAEPGGLLNQIIWILKDSEDDAQLSLVGPVEELKQALREILGSL